MSRVSLSELARRLGHNKGYIHKLKARGVLIFDSDGFIDEDAARAAIAESRDPSRGYMDEVNQQQRANHNSERSDKPNAENSPAAPSANANFMRARTMREALAAKTAQLEYRKRCGELVIKQAVNKEVTDAAGIIRQSLERLPNRLAERVAAESSADRCRALLVEEMDAALIELTALCERMAAEQQEAG